MSNVDMQMLRRLVLATVCAAAFFACGAFTVEGKFPVEGQMLVGVNYWGSKAGVHMWRADEWDEVEIEKDIAALAANGVELMRVFPTWGEFQPLVREWKFKQVPGLVLREGSDEEIYDPLWLDPGAVARFEKFCDIAERHNVKLMVSLVTGWMSGRLFTPRIVENKNLITDPDAMMWEGRFARAFEIGRAHV